ncbi:phage tail tip lysozyme [Nocardiopsis metallicus]|uniref:Phage tail lysozyme domain-containing protein n=1 Tax=Nocardiopsis metallicus TaxID=179819 RepID=A0A840W5P2_9ACTN|nr:phage tail tip lysozyme [Nocardiopsis metallicus]MBB5491314.1 hypothetical protein [Nocardiopsis metallicus]
MKPAGEGASAAKAADGAQALGKADKASKGLDGAGANLAGSAAQKAIEGDGDSKGRRTAGRYAGSAVSGAIGGAQKGAAAGGVGALPGAVIGAAKGVAVEGGKDVIKGGKKALGAGGTGYAREQQDQESPGSKAAKGVAVAGGIAAAPPAGALIALMSLLKWLKMLTMQVAAAALGFLQSVLAWVLSVPQMIGAVIGGVFGAIGSAIASVVVTVVGITIAPAVATASAVVAVVAAIALVAGMLASAVIDSQAAAHGDGGERSSHSCIVNTGSGPISVGDIDPDQEAHAQAVYKVLSGMGMPDENIAGILGNWEIESELDPTGVEGIYDEPYDLGPKKKAKLDGGGTNYGIGLGQWTADRHTKLLEYAEAAGGQWYDMEIQLSFMTDPDGDNPSDVAIVKGMVSEKKGSPSEAAEYFLTEWERAGVPALDARQEAAEKWFKAMDGWEEGTGSDSIDVEPVSDSPEQRDFGPVKPHVQKAADLIYSKFKDGPGSGIQSTGGYRSGGGSYDDDAHGHHVGLAVDFMVALDGEGKKTGDALAQYVIDNHEELGNVRYVIWQQRIWNLSAGDTDWQPMEDRGSPTQNHMDHPHVSWNSSGSVTDVAPVSTVSCSGGDSDGEGEGGGGGTVGLEDGGIDLKDAERLMELYIEEADEVLGEVFAGGGGPFKCNGSYVQNCTSFSWYFAHKYARWDKGYASNNGKDTARVMAQLLGTKASNTPTPYSVFSHGNSSTAGHTGIVLGVDGDRILIGEAAYCAFPGRARWVEASEWKNAGWSFTDLSDRIEGGEVKV